MPKSLKGLEPFIKFANYYKRFIKGLSVIIKLLTLLISVRKQFEALLNNA